MIGKYKAGDILMFHTANGGKTFVIIVKCHKLQRKYDIKWEVRGAGSTKGWTEYELDIRFCRAGSITTAIETLVWLGAE